MKRCDVMNLNRIVKTAYHAPMVITHGDLVFDVLPFSTLPVAIHVRNFWVVCCKAVAVAIVAFLYLTREAFNLPAARCTLDGDFVQTSCAGGETLPFTIARIATGYFVLGRPFGECLSADGATDTLLASSIVAVVLFLVLMPVDESALLARVSGSLDFLPATAGAIDDFRSNVNQFFRHVVCSFRKELYHA